MKRIILVCLPISVIQTALAQSIAPQTVNSAGSVGTMTGVMLEWSVGEMSAIQTLESSNTMLTQGLLQSGASTPLPVSLISFTGKTREHQNILEWVTSEETNNEYFDLEKSTNTLNFEVLERITGKGNSSQTKSYRAVDTAPHPAAYYRLKQVDFDGSYSYSKIIYLNRKDDLTFSIYPNPASDILFLRNSDQKTPLHLEIFDLSGKLVLQRSLSSEVIPIDIHELSVGFHVIKVTDPNHSKPVWSARFLKR